MGGTTTAGRPEGSVGGPGAVAAAAWAAGVGAIRGSAPVAAAALPARGPVPAGPPVRCVTAASGGGREGAGG